MPDGGRDRVPGDDGRAVARPNGPLARAQANVRALQALADIDTRKGEASAEELRELALYSGWGGQSDAFGESPKGEWAAVQAALKDRLSEKDYSEARASTLTAFYTPDGVADTMVSALGRLGVGAHGHASILEPGCGTGSLMAAIERAGIDATVTGVEVDPTSAAIARILHPSQTVVNAPLEDCVIPAGSFDAVVGNVPYSGDIRIDGRPIHDYFIARAVEAVRPGGVVCLLTSRFTLDSRDGARLRDGLARDAELLDVLRLPPSTFREAGTDVVCDLLVLHRRDEPLAETPDEAWTRTTEVSGARVNELVAKDPASHVVGTLSFGIGQFGPSPIVTSELGPEGVASAAAAALAAHLGASGDLIASAPDRLAEPDCYQRPSLGAAFEYVAADGRIRYGDGDAVEPVVARSATEAARLLGLVTLRDQARDLMALESASDDDARVGQAIASLRGAYDAFAGRFGRICSRQNQRAWGIHADYSISLLDSLERVRDGEFLGYGDILTTRIQRPRPPLPDHVDQPSEALSISIAETGRVDLGMVSRLLGTEGEGAALEALGDLVVTDPDTGEAVLAARYLSGDVRGKLDRVRSAIAAADSAADGTQAARDWLDRLVEEVARAADDGQSRYLDLDGEALAYFTESGAFDCYSDPDGSRVAVLPRAYLDPKDWRVSCRMYTAVARAWVESLDRGVPPTDLAGLAGGGVVGSDAREMVQTVAGRLLTGMGVDTIPADLGLVCRLMEEPRELVGDEALACLLATSGIADPEGTRAGSTVASALRRADPRCPFPSPDELAASRGPLFEHDGDGYRLNPRVVGPTLGTVSYLRDHPEDLEYVLSASARDPELADVSPSMLAGFAEHRSGFIAGSTQHAEPAAEALRRLESRLERAQPMDLGPGDVKAEIGASWVPPEVVLEFARDLLGVPSLKATAADRRRLKVEYSEATGRWSVTGGSALVAPDAELKWGTRHKRALELLQSALNRSTISIMAADPEDPKKRVLDPEATAAANERVRELTAAWDSWVFADPARAARLCALYNRRVNRIVPPRFDGEGVEPVGMNGAIELRPHQRAAIQRILLSDEGTLVAHSVGAGKTFVGVVAAMEARRLGKAAKPMFAVPNNLVEQWAADFARLYPRAKVLHVTGSDTSSADAMRRFWARVATGDWDAVIVGQSRFSQLRVSAERRAEGLERRVRELEESVVALRERFGKDSFTVKQAEGLRQRLRASISRLRDDASGIEGTTFEDLGVDWLFVDEAHNFKNLAIDSSLGVAGVTNTAAQKAEDMLDKCDYLRETGHGSNIIFATGTPVSNSMSELYNLERYLAPNLLEAQGVSAFSSWAMTFGSIVDLVEMRPEGSGFQVKKRFARFVNLPELVAATNTFADVVTPDDLHLDVPECEHVNVVVEPSESQRQAVAELSERATAVRLGQVAPDVDNLLKITTDGRKVALDPKLLYPDDDSIAPLPDGKVSACAARVRQIWEETAGTRGTQLVFCDASTPAGGSGRWNVVDALRDTVVALGVPESEVATVWEAGDSQKRRDALYARVDAGDVRVLIGSTQTLGTGVNVQTHLVATHDLDCPWRPSDLEQRLGRIVRQGNENAHVRNLRYVTAGTFDSYLYQTVERKQRFISQVFTGKSPVRYADDLDETVLDYGTIKALATGNPEIRRVMELQNQRDQLVLLRRAHDTEVERTRLDIRDRLAPTAEAAEARAREFEADLGLFRAIAQRDAGSPVVTVGGRGYPPQEANHALLEAARCARVDGRGTPTDIGTWNGATVAVCGHVPDVNTPVTIRTIAIHGNSVWRCRFSLPASDKSTATPLSQLDQIAASYDSQRAKALAALDASRGELAAARASVDAPWEREGELARLDEELARLAPTSDGDVEVVDEDGGRAEGPDEGQAPREREMPRRGAARARR